MGIAVQHSPPGAQQYNEVVENAIQRCNKIVMPSRRAAERRLGPGGFSCVRGLDANGDKLWAQSAKDAPQKLNQAAPPSKPGHASPQELFTGKKGAFLVVPFFQYCFMYRERRSKLDDKTVPCYFLNAGDNHADCSEKVLRADTGSACCSSTVTWAPLPQSGGEGIQYCPSRASTAHPAGSVIRDCLDAARRTHPAVTALSPLATAGTPSAATTWPPQPLLSSSLPSAHSPSAHTSPPPGLTDMPTATAGPRPAHSPSAHTPRATPPATAVTPSAAATWPPPPLLSSSLPSAHSPSAHTSPPPRPTDMPPATARPPPAHSSSAHTPRSTLLATAGPLPAHSPSAHTPRATPPATAGTPSAAATWPPPPLQSSSAPSAHSPSAHTSPPPGPTAMPPAAAGPPPDHALSAHTPPAACSPMPEWSPSSIEDAASTTSSLPSRAVTPGPADVQEETVAAGRRRIFLGAHPPRNVDGGREGRRARAGKDQVGGPSVFTRAGRSRFYAAVRGDVVRPRGRTLISRGEDVLLSLLANRRALNAQRVLLQGHGPGELGGGGKQHAGSGGVEESKGAPPYDTTGGGGSGGSSWTLGPSGREVPLGYVSRLITREDFDAALRTMLPSHLRSDMPLFHVKDLRARNTFREASDGRHGVQFMYAGKYAVT